MKAWFLFALFLTPAFALADSIEIRDIEEGEGPELVRHDTALVHYVGRLEEDGSEFDSSRGGQPLSVTIGSGQTIPGFEQAVKGMREGGKREAIIPPELAYGERGAGNIIPPNATLRFELEVVEVQRAPFSSLDNEGLAEKLDEGVTIVDIRRPDEWAETGVVEGSHRITAFEEDGQPQPGVRQQVHRAGRLRRRGDPDLPRRQPHQRTRPGPVGGARLRQDLQRDRRDHGMAGR